MDSDVDVDNEQIEQAIRLLATMNERREQACMAEIRNVLARYGCELVATLMIENGTITQAVRTRALQ